MPYILNTVVYCCSASEREITIALNHVEHKTPIFTREVLTLHCSFRPLFDMCSLNIGIEVLFIAYSGSAEQFINRSEIGNAVEGYFFY